jgi:hypothetical protein
MTASGLQDSVAYYVEKRLLDSGGRVNATKWTRVDEGEFTELGKATCAMWELQKAAAPSWQFRLVQHQMTQRLLTVCQGQNGWVICE